LALPTSSAVGYNDKSTTWPALAESHGREPLPSSSKSGARNEVAELLRRGEDFEVFCEELLGVKLNPAQKRIARCLKNGVDTRDREWAFSTLVVVAANQIGKTLIQACIILWALNYKIGLDDQNPDIWLASQYLWIHLGPFQQQAYHAYKDAKQLIKGAHPAQTGPKLPSALFAATKIENYYDGIECWNGAQAMFRTAENKGEAVLGYRAAGISVDEAAFVRGLTAEVNEVLKMRLVSTGGPIMLFSTPNGMNDFFDFADNIQSEDHEVEDMVWVNGSSRLVWATILDNVGYGISEKEAARMELELNPATKEQQLRGAFLEPAEAFFVPQNKIIEAFKKELPAEVRPIPGHLYAIFWDPSLASDPTAVVVLDVTYKPWTGVYFRWYERPLDITQLTGAIFQLHGDYHNARSNNRLSTPSHAVTGFDATSMGGAAVKGLLSPLNPKRPVNFGGNALKTPSLTNLRDLLTKGDIELPGAWLRLRQELLNYKLKDESIKQDTVMALMGCSIVARNMTIGREVAKFDVRGTRAPKRELRWN
jgi:hypothetical protein